MITALVVLAASLAHANWKVEACKKACIAPHDATELACKTVDTKEKEACLARNEASRKKCEADCAKPKPKASKKKKPAPKS